MYLLPACSLKLLVHTDGDEEQPLVPQPQVEPQPNVEPQHHIEQRPLQSMILHMHVYIVTLYGVVMYARIIVWGFTCSS